MTKPTSPDGDKLLSVRNIYKSFAYNAVLKGISMDLDRGEVLALIGGNGAGKSTLMKIIMGIYSHDSGEIVVGGREMTVGKPSEALANGVYMVPQEPLLFPNMTVEENILIGFNRPQRELHKELVETMESIGWRLELDRKASTLSIAEQQLVELLRGLLRHAQVLILDEPTRTLRRLKAFLAACRISRARAGHYLHHPPSQRGLEIATTVAIMRDGVVTLSGPITTKDDLVKGLLL
ncbi:MAG: ATP-binding cassette domain-containing protein [Anaerotruncus colihominis]